VKDSLTAIKRFSDAVEEEQSQTIELTVGGTVYPVAQWNKDIRDITRDSLRITYGDVTLTLDEYGNALLAEDVGETSDFMIVGHYSRGLVNGREVTYVDGWDISGEPLSLNLGNSASPAVAHPTNGYEAIYKPGDLVRCSNVDVPTNAEWKLISTGVYDVYQGDATGTFADADTDKAIRASDQYIKLVESDTGTVASNAGWAHGGDSAYADKGLVFIYVTFNGDGEVDSVEVVKGMQNATYGEIRSFWNTVNRPRTVNTIAEKNTSKPLYQFDDTTPHAAAEAVTKYYNAAQACVKANDDGSLKGTNGSDSGIKAMVIKSDSSSVGTRNIMYIRDDNVQDIREEDGRILNGYTVAMMGDDGTRTTETTVYSYDKR